MRISNGTRFDHYRILGPLGSGGMGEVYRARDEKLGRQVALKVLRPEHARDTDRLRRFEREAFSASALNHPNIVTIYDIGRSEGAPYIVMELVGGRTLRERLEAGELPAAEVLLIALQTTDGLAKAHEAGIVHRDLKPENLMITPDGIIKILDFGLAKLTEVAMLGSEARGRDGTVTSAGMIIGTVGYMSPEQACGRAADHRADQFALGTILYEMVTGKRAFERRTPVQTLSAIIDDEPEDPASVNPNVPAALSALIMRLLAKDPASRFDSTREVASALAALRVELRDGAEPPPFTARPRDGFGPTRVCPSCQCESPGDARFCGHCGSRMTEGDSSANDDAPTVASPSDPLPAGERRHCTVLSVYLSGFAGMVERLPPEQMESILGGLHAIAVESVESLEGLVNELTEGEMIFVFGLPKSHEDDSLRAARAGREIHQRVKDELATRFGLALSVQSGVSTGSLVTQPVSGSPRRYRLAGAPLERARWLASHADEGELLVTPDTERLLASAFELEPSTDMPVRRSGNVKTYRVVTETRVRTRLEISEASGMTAYVGRGAELDVLRLGLDRALSGGGQFITVVGDAGVGKSRLVYELVREVDREQITVLTSHCQSYSAGTPFLPFIELLREVLGVTGDLAEGRIVANTRKAMQEVSPELDVFLPIYLNLLSVETEEHPVPKHLQGEDLRLAILEAVSAFFVALARMKPAVLVFEDWHWADEASRAALTHLLGLARQSALLVLVTYRPELSVEWDGLLEHRRVALGPLTDSSSFHVIREALGVAAVPEGLAALIHEKTGGNPFFNEEVCHALLESGTVLVHEGRAELSGPLEGVHIPDSVQAVIRTRLDRLDESELDLLRRASVIGREFSRDVLERSLPETGIGLANRLERLKKSGLIDQVKVVPEAVYQFHHVLTQQVAYDSLLLPQRTQLHNTVGAAIESVYADRLEEHLDLLAHHFGLAESFDKAVRYGRASIKRAANLMQLPEALERLARTRGWLAALPESHRNREVLVELLLEEERILETLGERERQQAVIDQLLKSLSDEDAAHRAEVYLRQGELYTLVGEEEKAEAALEEAKRLGRGLNEPTYVRNALRSMGFLAWKQGEAQKARTLNEEALAIDRRLGDSDALAVDLHNLAQVVRSLGDHETALRYLDESLELSERQRNPVRTIYALNTMGTVYRDMGDLEKPLTVFGRSTMTAREHRLPVHLTFSLTNLAGIRRDRGEPEEAIRLLTEALELSESMNYTEGHAHALRNLADILETVGRYDEAVEAMRGAVRLFAQLHDGANELVAAALLARTVRKKGLDPEEASNAYRRAIELASALGRRDKEAELQNEAGILEWGEGRFEEALSHYERALQLFVSLEDDVHRGLMLNSIGVTLEKMGRHEEARSRLEEALAVHRRSGERLLEAHALALLGADYARKGEYERAREHFDRSLAARTALGDERGEAWMRYEIARVLRELGRREESDVFLKRASELASRVNDTGLKTSCERLAASREDG